MAGIKLEDLLGKKKEAPQVLDLSRSVVQTKEEFRRLLEKVPEYKIRPEKVRQDDVKVRDKDFSFRPPKRESKQPDYAYANPIPPDMRGVALEDLNPVAIDWKMLTSVRPKSKLEEEMFSRLVMMGKLHLRTAAKEKRSTNGSSPIHRNKNRAGIIETRASVCAECGEEFCSGISCNEFLYDCYLRTDVGTLHIDPSGNDGPPGRGSSPNRGRTKSGKKKKKKKQKRSRSGKRKKKGKPKSGNKKTEKEKG
ncbi:uncharacterized protein [Periplaneta americana]|uniref:uncharacterized protein n=1 Tax=Periplaneta americana TaxID=6978 RepID=UPI0037E8D28D